MTFDLPKVVIDTNIFRKDPRRKSVAFRALGLLAENKHIELHIPYIVEREFLSQRYDEHEIPYNDIKKGIKSLIHKKIPDNLITELNKIDKQVDKHQEKTQSWLHDEFIDWCNKNHAKRYKIDPTHTERVLDAYFKGNAPYKNKKKRSDIPDSFIFETVIDLLKETQGVHMVVEDGSLRKSCENLEHATTYKTLDEFIDSDFGQSLLRDQKIKDNFDQIISVLIKNTPELSQAIDQQAVNVLANTTISGDIIPDDNNQATISSVDEPENIEFIFEKAGYYGEGMVVIPFMFNVEALTSYYIFISDYYCLSDERSKTINVSPHNDHYYEAEEYFSLNVSGFLTVFVDIDQIENGANIEDVIDFETCDLDSIVDIEVET